MAIQTNALFSALHSKPENAKTGKYLFRVTMLRGEISGDKTAGGNQSELAVAYSITRNYARHLEVRIYGF